VQDSHNGEEFIRPFPFERTLQGENDRRQNRRIRLFDRRSRRRVDQFERRRKRQQQQQKEEESETRSEANRQG
jgi:hypothetical protein